jgi:valacyclovir hydrolase
MAWFEYGSSRIYFEAQGRGDPILIIPEFGGSIEQFSDLRNALVMAGYQVIAGDLPGSGRSEPQPRAYTASYFEEEALAFMALLQHLSSEPAHLVGFGNGGEICLLIAEMMPEVVQSVVTYGVAGTINDPEGVIQEAMFNVVDHPILSLQQFRDYLVSTYGEEQARAMTQSVAVAWNNIIEGDGQLSRSKADKITCPVLLIAGDHDFIAPPALVRELAARMHTAEMLLVENVEHFMYSDCHEWLTHTILDWLAKQPRKSPSISDLK